MPWAKQCQSLSITINHHEFTISHHEFTINYHELAYLSASRRSRSAAAPSVNRALVWRSPTKAGEGSRVVCPAPSGIPGWSSAPASSAAAESRRRTTAPTVVVDHITPSILSVGFPRKIFRRSQLTSSRGWHQRQRRGPRQCPREAT